MARRMHTRAEVEDALVIWRAIASSDPDAMKGLSKKERKQMARTKREAQFWVHGAEWVLAGPVVDDADTVEAAVGRVTAFLDKLDAENAEGRRASDIIDGFLGSRLTGADLRTVLTRLEQKEDRRG